MFSCARWRCCCCHNAQTRASRSTAVSSGAEMAALLCRTASIKFRSVLCRAGRMQVATFGVLHVEVARRSINTPCGYLELSDPNDFACTAYIVRV